MFREHGFIMGAGHFSVLEIAQACLQDASSCLKLRVMGLDFIRTGWLFRRTSAVASIACCAAVWLHECSIGTILAEDEAQVPLGNLSSQPAVGAMQSLVSNDRLQIQLMCK